MSRLDVIFCCMADSSCPASPFLLSGRWQFMSVRRSSQKKGTHRTHALRGAAGEAWPAWSPRTYGLQTQMCTGARGPEEEQGGSGETRFPASGWARFSESNFDRRVQEDLEPFPCVTNPFGKRSVVIFSLFHSSSLEDIPPFSFQKRSPDRCVAKRKGSRIGACGRPCAAGKCLRALPSGDSMLQKLLPGEVSRLCHAAAGSGLQACLETGLAV